MSQTLNIAEGSDIIENNSATVYTENMFEA